MYAYKLHIMYSSWLTPADESQQVNTQLYLTSVALIGLPVSRYVI